jgi:hypothetical protein
MSAFATDTPRAYLKDTPVILHMAGWCEDAEVYGLLMRPVFVEHLDVIYVESFSGNIGVFSRSDYVAVQFGNHLLVPPAH